MHLTVSLGRRDAFPPRKQCRRDRNGLGATIRAREDRQKRGLALAEYDAPNFYRPKGDANEVEERPVRPMRSSRQSKRAEFKKFSSFISNSFT